MSAFIISRISVVKPFLAAIIAITAAGLLVVLNHLSLNVGSEIITVLWIILIAALLITTVQIAHTEKVFSKHIAQLVAHKERLANEIKYRLWAEKTSSESKSKLQIIDENFPVMLAYFNTEQQCRYHNRAFRQWFGLKPEQIDNQFLREFFSAPFYLGVKHVLQNVLSGETIQNQHTQELANGSACLITGQLVPHFDSNGKVIGFYTLYTPHLLKEGEQPLEPKSEPVSADCNPPVQEKKSVRNNHPARHQAKSSIDSSERIVQAIEQGEFSLYCQKIVPTKSSQDGNVFYELLIRMAEEESNLIPPGAFLPFVEKYNLMPRLDRWVVDQAIQWIVEHGDNPTVSFCINVARDTLEDNDFVVYIQRRLAGSRIQSNRLCFEIETLDAAKNLSGAAVFVKKMDQLGCHVSLSSFDHDEASLHVLKNIKTDFLKIDGSLICNILHDSSNLGKVQDINRIAHILKIKTIGELVETQDVLNKLTEINIDYAQGFGVGRPNPLKTIK